MRMNLRRGLLRLWIVASVLWCAVIGYLGYGEYKEAPVEAPGWELLLPVECGSARGSSAQDYGQKDGFCWYMVGKFRQLFPEYKDIDDKTIADKIYAKAGMPQKPDHRRRDKLVEIAELGILPPLGVLVVGWSLTWAFAGFRRGDTSA